MMKCRICGSSKGSDYNIKEMMFGTRDMFEYFKCDNCGTLQIKEIPDNLASYYHGDSYYSMDKDYASWYNTQPKKTIRSIYYNILLNNKNFVKKRFHGHTEYALFKDGKLPKNIKILDIGCGGGKLLFFLQGIGFNCLKGIDPFISDTIVKQGVEIKKGYVEELNEKFELLISSHQLEHVENPLEELKNIAKLMNKDSKFILRIPVVDSYGWQVYKEKWLQIDAPRHINIFSRKAIYDLIDKAGLICIEEVNDMNIAGLFMSDAYIADIPIIEQADYNAQFDQKIKNKLTKKYKQICKEENEKRNGDQISLIIKLKQ
jgi:SAM-dependent methyltransferase